NNLKIKDINSELINKILKETLNKEVILKNTEILDTLDPLNTIKKRTHVGGPAPNEVLRDYKDKKEKLNKIRNENKVRMEKNELKKLQEIINNLIKGDA
ncbi:MAG: hypothetical protein ACTSVY_12135, partial [Candidatus Helarchaeota archaeon]